VHQGKSGRSHTGTSTETRGDRNETLKLSTVPATVSSSRRPRSAFRSFGLATLRALHLGPRHRVVASWQLSRIGVLTITSPTGKSGQATCSYS
jgi:hypothetical protein